MKQLPLGFILFALSIVLGIAAIMSAPTADDYTLHTNEQAMNNVLMLLVIASFSMIGAIVVSLSDESKRTKPTEL